MSSKAEATDSLAISVGLFYSLIMITSAGLGIYGLINLLSLLHGMLERIQSLG